METFEYDGEMFVQDEQVCTTCGQSFKFSLPVGVMPFWPGVCAKCNPMMHDVLDLADGEMATLLVEPVEEDTDAV